MFAIVLSSLALLAAVSALVLAIRVNINSQKWNADYAITKKAVEDLNNGVVPDYEKAKAAVTAVNDFNAGISGILGFDPYEAIKAKRGEED